MKRFRALFFLIAGVFVLSSPLGRMAFGEEKKIAKDEIVIDTPKKKAKGKATAVTFPHAVHAEKQAKGDCKVCHATIKQALNAPENTKKVTHKACKSCHKKGKPAEKLSKCKSCHKPKE